MKYLQSSSDTNPEREQEFEGYLCQVGRRLKDLRSLRKENLKTVSLATGISIHELKKIESGKVNFQLEILFQLCDHYNISGEEIVKWDI